MQRRSIAHYSEAEFGALRARLEGARDTLRRDGRLLQSIARAYYVVYAVASFAAGKHGVKATHVRDRELVVDQAFSHTELPAVVYTLYTGLKKETISEPGDSPGIGAGNYDEREAYRQAGRLVQLRLEADYGPSDVAEPYDTRQADSWLLVARNLTQDLESSL